MPAIEKLSEKLNIDIPADIAALVRQAVDEGDYSSQSEVVQHALQDWTRERHSRLTALTGLRQAWQEAVADDSEGEDPGPVLDALERKYEALAQAAEK